MYAKSKLYFSDTIIEFSIGEVTYSTVQAVDFRVYRWSSGVIMYTLLAGSPPFWHRKQMLMLRMILAGRYDFSSPEWEDCSDTVKDLVGLFKNI